MTDPTLAPFVARHIGPRDDDHEAMLAAVGQPSLEWLVDRAVPAANLLRAAKNADKALITEVAVFDVFEGKGVPEGKKSLGIAVTLQPMDKTLTDEEIEKVSASVVAAVTKATGGVLRA